MNHFICDAISIYTELSPFGYGQSRDLSFLLKCHTIVVPPPICTLKGKYKRFQVLGGTKNAFPVRTTTCFLPIIDKPLVEIVLHSCSKIALALSTAKLVLRSFLTPAGLFWPAGSFKFLVHLQRNIVRHSLHHQRGFFPNNPSEYPAQKARDTL